MKGIFAICLIITFLLPVDSYACSCSSATYKFVSNIRHYDFVGLVQIIGRDSIINKEIDRTFTIVKIIKQYRGSLLIDTIKVLESGGVDCYDCLPFNKVGDQFIIKASYDRRRNWEGDLIDFVKEKDNLNEEMILTLFICEVNTLTISADSVSGSITKKDVLKKTPLDSVKKIVKVDYNRKFEKFGYYVRSQEMSLSKVERIIIKRVN